MRLQRSVLITVGQDAADIARHARDELASLKLPDGACYPGQLVEIIPVPERQTTPTGTEGEALAAQAERSGSEGAVEGSRGADLRPLGSEIERALRRLKSRELTLALEYDYSGVQPDPRVQCFIIARAGERGVREEVLACLKLLHGAYPGGDLPIETSCFLLLPGFYGESCGTEEERDLLYGEAYVTLWSLEGCFNHPEEQHLRQDLLGSLWVVDSEDETGQYAGPIAALKRPLGEMIAALISSSLIATSRRSLGRPFKSIGFAQLVFDRERVLELVSEEVVTAVVRERLGTGRGPLATTIAAEASTLVENLRLAHIGQDAGAETVTAFPKAPLLGVKERETTAGFLASTRAAIHEWESRVFPPLKERLWESSSLVRAQRFAELRAHVVTLVDSDPGGLLHASALLEDLCGSWSGDAFRDDATVGSRGRLGAAISGLKDQGQGGVLDPASAPEVAGEMRDTPSAGVGTLPSHEAVLSPLRRRIGEQEEEIRQREVARAACETEMSRQWAEVVHLRDLLLRIALPVCAAVAAIALAAAAFLGFVGVAYFVGSMAAWLAALVAASFYLVHRRAYRWFRKARTDEEKHRETLRDLEILFCDSWGEYFGKRLRLLEVDVGIQELSRVLAAAREMQGAILCFRQEAEKRGASSPESGATRPRSCTTMYVVEPQDLPFLVQLIGAKPADDAARFFAQPKEGGHRLSGYLFPAPRLDALASDLVQFAERRYRPRVDAISVEDLAFDHYSMLSDSRNPSARACALRTLMHPLVRVSESAQKKRAQNVIHSFGVQDTETSRFRDVIKSIGGLEAGSYFPLPGGDRFTAVAIVDCFALRDLAQAAYYRAALLRLADPSGLLPSGASLAAAVGTEGGEGNGDASIRSLLLCGASLDLSPMDGLSADTDDLLKRLEGVLEYVRGAPSQIEELDRRVRGLEDESSQAVRGDIQQRIFRFVDHHGRVLSFEDLRSLEELALRFAPVL